MTAYSLVVAALVAGGALIGTAILSSLASAYRAALAQKAELTRRQIRLLADAPKSRPELYDWETEGEWKCTPTS